MKAHFFPLLLLSTILSSCMTQPGAPIDYGSSTASSGKISSSSDDIVERPITHETTNWGDDKIQENTENVNPNEQETPQTPPLRTEIITHEVIEDETVNSIAAKYDITPQALIKANNLKAPYALEPLQILNIPPQISSDIEVGDIIAPSNAAPVASVQAPTSRLPVAGSIISKFGDDNNGIKNNGINIQASLGADIYSLRAGSVAFAGNDAKFGNLIIIKLNDDDIFMAYSHMNDLILKKGDSISNGQIIGHVGQTGNVTSPQLHFAVRQGKTPIDPVEYLSN